MKSVFKMTVLTVKPVLARLRRTSETLFVEIKLIITFANANNKRKSNDPVLLTMLNKYFTMHVLNNLELQLCKYEY